MKNKKIAVIGLGDFGKQLVRCLNDEGHEIIAIDKNIDHINEIKDFCTNAIAIDSTDETAMKAQGLEEMDYVVLAVADDFETLIITSDILKNLGVKEIIARYQTELHIRILKMLGITNIFNPEEKAARNMSEMFVHSNIKGSMIISEEFRIAELLVPSFFIGKSVSEVGLKEKHNLLLITVKRLKSITKLKRRSDDQIIETLGIPSANTVFREKDIMVVFGNHLDVEKFLNII
jgi:trk system potassium uptake protein TrkA